MAETVSLVALPGNFGEHFFQSQPTLRQRQQARKFANEAYIASVTLTRLGENKTKIQADCHRSQRKTEECHHIILTVDESEQKFIHCHCSCKAGMSGDRAHVVATVYKITDWLLQGLKYIPAQPACTSCPQTWDKPRGTRLSAEPVSSMVISRPGNTNRKMRPAVADIFDNRKIPLQVTDIEKLQTMDGTPLSYLANKGADTSDTEYGSLSVGCALSYQLPHIEINQKGQEGFPCGDINFPKLPDNTDHLQFMDSSKFTDVDLTLETAIRLEEQTRRQSDCPLWSLERSKRLTASNFGRFMLRKSPVTQKFVDSIINPKRFTSAATGYGVANEKIAKNMYAKHTNFHIHDCGLVVNPKFPFLGASPDGKVCDHTGSGILEVKCPFSIRDITVTEALQSDNFKEKICVEMDWENIVIVMKKIFCTGTKCKGNY